MEKENTSIQEQLIALNTYLQNLTDPGVKKMMYKRKKPFLYEKFFYYQIVFKDVTSICNRVEIVKNVLFIKMCISSDFCIKELVFFFIVQTYGFRSL